LGGIPPLRGFITKFLIIEVLANHSLLAIFILIAGSIINLFFYINIVLNILITTQLSKQKNKFSTLITLLATNFLIIFIMLT